MSADSTLYREQNPEKVKLSKERARQNNIEKNSKRREELCSADNLLKPRRCVNCKTDRTKADFAQDLGRTDGFLTICKICVNEIARKKWHIDEQKREKSSAYQKENKEIYRRAGLKYYHENIDECRARNKQWRDRNKGPLNAKYKARKLAKKKAIPPWANLAKIEEFYEQAQILSKETGIKHSVDHIIPLKGELVSGLHVETNLRVIPLTENLSKKNKFLEELL